MANTKTKPKTKKKAKPAAVETAPDVVEVVHHQVEILPEQGIHPVLDPALLEDTMPDNIQDCLELLHRDVLLLTALQRRTAMYFWHIGKVTHHMREQLQDCHAIRRVSEHTGYRKRNIDYCLRLASAYPDVRDVAVLSTALSWTEVKEVARLASPEHRQQVLAQVQAGKITRDNCATVVKDLVLEERRVFGDANGVLKTGKPRAPKQPKETKAAQTRSHVNLEQVLAACKAEFLRLQREHKQARSRLQPSLDLMLDETRITDQEFMQHLPTVRGLAELAERLMLDLSAWVEWVRHEFPDN